MDKSSATIGVGKEVAQNAFWKALADRQREKR
jgi:hypothetical protein